MPTIITRVTPDCTINGRALHYDQPRILTVMEARRAQSYPDHEVLIGDVAAQWKIVGNSVDRTMAAATGVSLRFAWLANDPAYPKFVDDYVLDGDNRMILPDPPREGNDELSRPTEDISSEEDAIRLPGRVDSGKKLTVKSAEPETDDDLIIVRTPKDTNTRRSFSAALAEYKKARKGRQSLPARLTAQVEPRTRESTDELGDNSAAMLVASVKPVAVRSSTIARQQAPSVPSDSEHTHNDAEVHLQVDVLVPATQAAVAGPPPSAPALQSIPSTLPTATPPVIAPAQPRSAPAAEPLNLALSGPQTSSTASRLTANSAPGLAAVQTSGLLSPAPSRNATPISITHDVPTIPAEQPATVKAPSSSLPPRSPSRHYSDGNEGGLRTHIDNAIAVTDTSLLGLDGDAGLKGDINVEDAHEEAHEHADVSEANGEIPKIPSSAIAGAEDTDSEWMDYELTG